VPSHYPTVSVSLDSNVLFSASRKQLSRFHEFWRFYDVKPITSLFSINEVRRHLESLEHRTRFEFFLAKTTIVPDGPIEIIPPEIVMVAKDRQILATAISARADYLVTGDMKHFGHLYGRNVGRVKILPPREFLDLFAYRLIP
jgi:predicted nucleic acid-binding protein